MMIFIPELIYSFNNSPQEVAAQAWKANWAEEIKVGWISDGWALLDELLLIICVRIN